MFNSAHHSNVYLKKKKSDSSLFPILKSQKPAVAALAKYTSENVMYTVWACIYKYEQVYCI